MPSQLSIKPFSRPVGGSVELPGSKSITNRALLMAALCNQEVTISNALCSDDTEIMVEALRALGFRINSQLAGNSFHLKGLGGHIPNPQAKLTVGNSGTVARFLTAFLCLRDGGCYSLDGDAAMRNRPMKGLLDVLASLGAGIDFAERPEHFPFTLRTHGLPGGRVQLDASASSQILSALLIVGPYARDGLEIGLTSETVSRPFIQMTSRMMEQFGFPRQVEVTERNYHIEEGREYYLPGGAYQVEPDATAAGYFAALPLAVGGSVSMRAFPSEPLQGDCAFLTLLAEKTALRLEIDSSEMVFQFEGGHRMHTGREPVILDFNAISDTFLTLAALAPLLESPLQLTGIGHTRGQETDRMKAVTTELRKLGQQVEEEADQLLIRPDAEGLRRRAAKDVLIETYDDHRIAMSFAILGCADILKNGRPWLQLAGAGCVSKTFPRFFDTLNSLRPGP